MTEPGPGPTRPARQRLIVLIAITAVLSLVTGFAAAQIWPAAPDDASAEAGFTRDMSTHHAQAVELAMLGFEKASSPELRTLGYDIALTQQAQIGIMSAWLTEWDLLPTGSQPRMAWMPDGDQAVSKETGLMPGMASPAEVAQLKQASGREFDVMFCQLMQRHHLGGIHMVDEVLKLSDDAEVTRLAKTMKTGQQKEVAVFQAQLAALNAS